METAKDNRFLTRVEKALDLLEESEVEEGLKVLKMCEERLSLMQDIEMDLKLIVFHNLALCYQMLQEFDECAVYLEKTIKVASGRDFAVDIEKIRNARYLCMLHIQLGAIMSHLGDHTQAVCYAKQAFNHASASFQHCVAIAASTKGLPDSSFQNYKTLETCLQFLSGKLPKFPPNCRKIIQRTSLGVLHFNDWIYSFTINDILDIKPLKYFEVKNTHTFAAELSKDFMLEKLCLLLAACYLIATETRLLDDPGEVKKAKGWHLRAVEIGSVLVPLETPLMQHIKSSYEKHYPVKVLPKVIKTSKSKTPVKESRCISARNKTPMRPRMGMPRKIIKEVEVKTDRSFIKENTGKKAERKEETGKSKTTREDNQEPEPQISEDYDDKTGAATFIINSNELYGIYSDDERQV